MKKLLTYRKNLVESLRLPVIHHSFIHSIYSPHQYNCFRGLPTARRRWLQPLYDNSFELEKTKNHFQSENSAS